VARRADPATTLEVSSVVTSLRRWWWLPLALSLVGGGIGYGVGGHSPVRSVILLRVGINSQDSTLVTQAVQTARYLIDSPQVFEIAARGTGRTPADLQSRSVITPVDSSQVISVAVTAPTASEAAAMSEAVAKAAIAVSDLESQNRLNDIRARGNNLLSTEQLDDRSAEAARRSQIGQSVAASQSSVIASSDRLSVLTRQPAAATGISSPMVISALGAFGGLLLGCAFAYMLGARRGRVRNLNEIRLAFPQIESITSDEMPNMLADTVEGRGSLIFMASTSAAAETEAVHRACGALEQAGLRPIVIDTRQPMSVSMAAVIPRAERELLLEERRADVILLSGPATRALIRRVSNQADSSVVILIHRKITRHRELNQLVGEIGVAPAVLVLGP